MFHIVLDTSLPYQHQFKAKIACVVCFLSVRGKDYLSLQYAHRNQPYVLEIPLRDSPLPSKGLKGLLSTSFYPNKAKFVR